MKLSNVALAPRAVDEGPAHQADDIRNRLSAALRIVDDIANVPVVRQGADPVQESDVRSLIKLRRARDRFFAGDIFADPAWDILLELYASELGQRRISVSALCMAAAVPPTTALRWINALESAGVIGRSADPRDGRRFFVALSALGLEAMNSYFRIVPKGTALI